MTRIFKTPKKVNVYNKFPRVKDRQPIKFNVDWIGVGIDYDIDGLGIYSVAIIRYENGDIDVIRLDLIQEILPEPFVSILSTMQEHFKKVKIISCASNSWWYSKRIGDIFDIIEINTNPSSVNFKRVKVLNNFDIGYIEPDDYIFVD